VDGSKDIHITRLFEDHSHEWGKALLSPQRIAAAVNLELLLFAHGSAERRDCTATLKYAGLGSTWRFGTLPYE